MLNDLLQKKRKAILEKWLDLILETYPADTVAMMRKNKDQFTNPVAATISRETENLFIGLCEGVNLQGCSAPLDAILKIRSVQDFSPSQAVGFIFLLKGAIGEILGDEISKAPVADEWLKFQSRVDDLILQAFDLYMACREKVCEIRVKQARAEKEMAFRMMERMGFSREKREKEEE